MVNNFLTIDTLGPITKITNNSDYNVYLSYIPLGKRKIEDIALIPCKSFWIYEHKIDFSNIFIRFKNENI